MAVERTLSMIKPDAVGKNYIGKIYARFEDAGLQIEDRGYSGGFWSIYWPMAWLSCEPGGGLPFNNPHPMCVHWTKSWEAVQAHPQGHLLRDALNELLPKSQWILARKPG